MLGAYIQPDMWNDLLKTHDKLVVYKGNSIEEITDHAKMEQVTRIIRQALDEVKK